MAKLWHTSVGLLNLRATPWNVGSAASLCVIGSARTMPFLNVGALMVLSALNGAWTHPDLDRKRVCTGFGAVHAHSTEFVSSAWRVQCVCRSALIVQHLNPRKVPHRDAAWSHPKPSKNTAFGIRWQCQHDMEDGPASGSIWRGHRLQHF